MSLFRPGLERPAFEGPRDRLRRLFGVSRLRGGASLSVCLAAAAIVPVTALAAVSWQPSYTGPQTTTPSSTASIGGWDHVQAPPVSTSPNPPTSPTTGRSTRIDIEANPGTTPIETSPFVLRAEVQRGDKTTSGGSAKPRTEAYTQAPGAKGNNGFQTWYGFSLRLDPDWKTATKAADLSEYTSLMQWKGDTPGQAAPLALLVEGGHLVLNRQVQPDASAEDGYSCKKTVEQFCKLDLGPLPLGTWTRLAIGVQWSTASSPADGYICVKRDGQRVDFGQTGPGYCTSTNVQTLQLNPAGGPDSTYVKQGIYQSAIWDSEPAAINHVAWYSPLKVSPLAFDVGGW